MWSGNDDYNENGEPVILYLPSQGPPRKSNTNPLDSHIGGHSSDSEDIPTCAKCNSNMFLFVQLRLDDGSDDRFLCVYGCPRTDCFKNISFENGFASGGQGVMKCIRKRKPKPIAEKLSAPAPPAKSSWYDNDGDADNDWGMDSDGGDDDIANLESAVAAMEANLEAGSTSKSSKQGITPKGTKPIETTSSKDAYDAFRCYMLKRQDEPPAPRQLVEEDDVGMGASDDKIRNMLARYMAEEEDENILAALRGTITDSGAGGEEDERMAEEDRILLGFQDRLRRASRQVVRYAKDGIPLWSIPSENKKNESLWKVPPCSCGAQRIFECQLLPSVLQFLEVDKFSGKQQEDGINNLMSNGINWGSVAIFTCPKECEESEEALVIQESVDEINEDDPQFDFTPVVAVVEEMDDDDEFIPDA